MASGSLIGFALAFVATSWATSLVLSAAALLTARRMRRDPGLERTAATLALVVPPILASAALLAIIVHSIAAAGGADHCGDHAHHLHLCLTHGAAWAASAWAVGAVVSIGTAMLARATALLVAHVRGARAIADLRRIAVETDGVFLVPSDRPFLFTAGLWPGATFASSAAWQVLDPGERAAAVAHEQAHRVGRDLLRRAGLGFLAIAGAPFASRRILRLWDSATERLRDRDAAAAVGDETSVASALVALARAGAASPAWSAPLAPEAELSLRVASVLDGQTSSRSARTWLAAASGIALAVAIPAAFVAADPLHHLLETVLGVF